MSRADDLRARYEAEMAVVSAEDDLLAAKESGDPQALAEAKTTLREARRAFRTEYGAVPAEAGDAVASPDAVAVKASISEAGS